MATFNEDIVRGGGGLGGLDGGGGLLGIVALLALLGRNGGGGLFGGGNSGGVDSLNNLQGAIDTNAILSKLATIEGSIPLSEAQVQLALSGVSAQTLQQTIELMGALSTAQAANSAGFCNVVSTVEKSGWNLSNTIHDEGEKTRALITSNQIADLQADKVILANEVSELRNESSRAQDRHGIEISMVNNQNQNQLQFQAQSQALNQVANVLAGLTQSIHATNQAINVGGTQLASPTNTNTNIR